MAESLSILARAYARIDAEIREHNGAVDVLKEHKLALERKIVDGFTDEGIQSMNVDGKTVHLQRTLWPKLDTSREEVMEALEDVGWGDIVRPNFNSNSLAGMIRDLDRDDEDMPIMPPELEGKISVSEKREARVKNS